MNKKLVIKGYGLEVDWDGDGVWDNEWAPAWDDEQSTLSEAKEELEGVVQETMNYDGISKKEASKFYRIVQIISDSHDGVPKRGKVIKV